MEWYNLLTDAIQTETDVVEVEICTDDCIISIPHHSPLVPKRYLSYRRFTKRILLDTDLHTDRLFDARQGTIIKGKCNPYFINYSRPRESYSDSRGVLPIQFLDGSTIERKTYGAVEREKILRAFYDPYHHELEKAIRMMKAKRGYALIIDGHGMAKYPLPGCVATDSSLRPDFNLGTLDGKSIPLQWTTTFQEVIELTPFTLKIDDPYKGGFITQKYSQLTDVYVLQIETVKENYLKNTLESGFVIDPEGLRKCKEALFHAIHAVQKRLDKEYGHL